MLGSRPSVLLEGRVHVLHFSGLVRGGIVLANIYLQSGVGVNAFNYKALSDLACRLKEFGRPYIVGGDFNCTKQELVKSGVLKLFDAVVVDTLEHTCMVSCRSIDMFIVSRELQVENIRVVSGSPVHPHKPVILELLAPRPRPWVRVVATPKPFPVL